MCKYCADEPRPLIRSVDLIVFVDAFHGKLCVNYHNGQVWEYETVRINFCPMCGRDLRKEGE